MRVQVGAGDSNESINKDWRSSMVGLNEMFDLRGKIALVTGGSRGLGFAMARTLGLAGATVVITARKQQELDEAVAELTDAGCAASAIRNDLADPASIPSLVEDVLTRFGKIDVLVNNAGATWGANAENMPIEAWRKVVEVNLNGTWALTQEVARRSMIPRRQGSIVIISSLLGTLGNRPGEHATVAYNTTKAAQINLARTLAGEWGVHGVRVNCILPGWFLTKMTNGTLTGEVGARYVEAIPLARLGESEDLAGPILFLASDASCYVTGQSLAVDGGRSAVL
jgi:gluconate 5-dehydrogenase